MLRHFLAALTAREMVLAAITSFAAAATSVGLYIELAIIIQKTQNKMCVGFICLLLCHAYMSLAFVLLLPIATLNVVMPLQVQKLLIMGAIPLPYFISYNAMKLTPCVVWMKKAYGVYLIGSYGNMLVSKAPLTQILTLLFYYLWMITFFQWIYTTKEASFYDVFARTTDGFNERFNITPCIELGSQVVGKTDGLE